MVSLPMAEPLVGRGSTSMHESFHGTVLGRSVRNRRQVTVCTSESGDGAGDPHHST
jgi:hypothetical protein